MNASKRLRENIQQTMAQSSSDLEAQKNATEFAMRRRIHETQQARDELEWQKKRVNLKKKIDINFKLILIIKLFERLKQKFHKLNKTLKL